MTGRELAIWLARTQQAMHDSPLRAVLRERGVLPGDRPADGHSGAYTTAARLAKLSEELQDIVGRLGRPLHLVVMGEVKAGKSTLVNALVGRLVAPMDVLEATACIMEIRSGERDRAAIIYRDGQRREGLPEEVAALLAAHQGDPGFFDRVSHVEVELRSPGFSDFFLVDTPGVATLTQANEQRARDYLSRADVVLWVLNGMYLGQTDVAEEIANVARTGRPILGVINKMDLATAPAERVVRYVERDLGHYFDAIFPLSALRAWEALQTGAANAHILRESGLLALTEYLDSSIRRRVEAAHVVSLTRSAVALLREERIVHDTYRRDGVERLVRLTEETKTSLERKKQAISIRLEGELRRDAEAFLYQYRDQAHAVLRQRWSAVKEWMNRVAHAGAPHQPDSGPVDDVLSLQPVRDWWEARVTHYTSRMSELWERELAGLKEHLVGAGLLVETPGASLAEPARATTPSEDAGTAIGESVVAGAAASAATAAYLAWLGPAAAQLAFFPTLGALALPVGLPVFVTWLATKVIRTWSQRERQKQQAIDVLYSSFANWVMDSYIEGYLIPALRDVNEKVAKDLFADYVRSVCAALSVDSLVSLSSSIQIYVASLERLESEVDWKELGASPREVSSPGDRAGSS